MSYAPHEGETVNDQTLAVVAGLFLAWAAVCGLLARHSITGPFVFAISGFVLANPDWGPLTVDVNTESIHGLAEVTLALVLFTDASRVKLSELRADVGLPGRMLGIGFPLTLLLGGLAATLILGDFTWALACYVSASLAPTDAALSVQVINDERVPSRLRRALNIESGLNDGIVTPIVTLALALVASQMTGAESEAYAAGTALRQLGVGLLVGLISGLAGAAAINAATRRGWAELGPRRIATLATAVMALMAAIAVDANGFISAFVAGMAFAAVLDEDQVDPEEVVLLPELGGEVLALVVWFIFGATLVPIAFSHLDVPVIVYALLSLTIVRMVPVAISMAGTGLDRRSVLFLGWFGPRGLASVVFAVMAIEELGEAANEAVAVISLTILFSVILHGVTAGPVGPRYAQTGTASAEAPMASRSRRTTLIGPHRPGGRAARPRPDSPSTDDAPTRLD